MNPMKMKKQPRRIERPKNIEKCSSFSLILEANFHSLFNTIEVIALSVQMKIFLSQKSVPPKWIRLHLVRNIVQRKSLLFFDVFPGQKNHSHHLLHFRPKCYVARLSSIEIFCLHATFDDEGIFLFNNFSAELLGNVTAQRLSKRILIMTKRKLFKKFFRFSAWESQGVEMWGKIDFPTSV